MSAPVLPASGVLARAVNPMAAAASSFAATTTAAAGAEIVASGIATTSCTASMAAGRSSAVLLRSAHVGVTTSIGASAAGAATRTFTTTATTLVKDAHKSSSPAAAAIREAAQSPEANSRIRVTDGPPPDLSYVAEGTPVTSQDPKTMPAASPSSIPASQSQHASTKSGARHPGVAEMAKGATLPGAGEDAITPEERSTKAWSTNQRPADYNPEEGKRNPILHGGSNEGGFDADGKSKT